MNGRIARPFSDLQEDSHEGIFLGRLVTLDDFAGLEDQRRSDGFL